MWVWRLGKTLPGQFDAKDMTGEGAYRYGGRWNSIGLHAVYASLTPSTAVLESIVHLGRMFNPIDRYLIAIEIPDDIWNDNETGVSGKPQRHSSHQPAASRQQKRQYSSAGLPSPTRFMCCDILHNNVC